PYILRPFTEPECSRASPARLARMRMFNKLVSSIRVRVEQAFGILKGRFPGLKILGTPSEIANAYRTVEALMSIHNFCIDNDDHPEAIPWFDWRDPEVDAAIELARAGILDDEEMGNVGGPAEEQPGDDLRELGHQMREELFNVLFPPE
ncbi:uncharacterized protein B0H18DRAFT_833061, partial [Fomitopsis serialis]|uniref:uncharacterized protein n=1 Tax=Fomitopsis serialis TaxID=139415 RepID=UPI0020085435